MNWALAIVCLLVGLGLGFLAGKRSGGSRDNTDRLQQELAQARFDLEQQRQGVADYFAQSQELMTSLSQQFEKTNRFWQESAKELTDEPAMVAENDEVVETSNVTSLPPNDYVQGSHGIINPETRVANQ
ncbi:ZapG family protein [Ferrimonas lipolytica]|uniref:Z-ring associated protein G n=1 Tax=Ferrimonas lipolytica TaxID=2724191 RepID=A0A6H1UFJ8_9GAMM|nr:DUF1043 family protein [Ferrimonas lipolytica]QIZ77877.1 DUF1043 family protein [Ferrimonas lipolytica]